jgi:putative SOS response-associated peptidase YedK
MCARFTQNYSWSEVHAVLSLIGAPRNLRPRYNIAPTTPIDVVRLGAAGRELVSMRWGLVPFFWKKALRDLPATFNARAETVASKPMFRDSFRRRRCVIPASGFFEWTGDKGDKVPHLFTAADGAPVLAFAGLWDSWTDPAGDEVLSATVVVSGASAWMAPYHDRMPVLLAEPSVEGWLDGSLGADALRPAAEDALREWVVSKRVNRTGAGDDDPTLLDPVDGAARGTAPFAS